MAVLPRRGIMKNYFVLIAIHGPKICCRIFPGAANLYEQTSILIRLPRIWILVSGRKCSGTPK